MSSKRKNESASKIFCGHLQAGGAFPASELPSKSDKISEEEQSAGRELETSHTGVPRNTRQSNAAASKAASSASEQASTVANDALSSGVYTVVTCFERLAVPAYNKLQLTATASQDQPEKVSQDQLVAQV